MSKIKIKEIIAIIAGKFTLFLSKHILKGGSNFPGKIALKIDSDILKKISENYKVILITGTNGKTTTTSMVNGVLQASGLDTITNATGANMLPGIISCFLKNYKFSNSKTRYAVLEVDEANVKFITEHITPEIICITNLFRDQLDRYGEVYTTLNKIMEGIYKVPESTLLLNGDESLLGRLDVPNKKVYYGFNESINKNTKVDTNADAKFCKFCKSPYHYNFITYNHLGDFYCPNCGYKREELSYAVTKLIDVNADYSKVAINDHEFTITQSGLYNIYNALCAYSIAKMSGISEETIRKSFEKQASSFGRQEEININGKKVTMILVKNPAGYNQAIDLISLNKFPYSCCFMLNDNYADGRDVSWIWDVHYETLANTNIKDIIISGSRMYDMAVRLKTANLNTDSFIIKEDYKSVTESIASSSEEKVYILATYTAMINYRKYLHSNGYIKKLW